MIAGQTELWHSSALPNDKIRSTLLIQETGPHSTAKEDLAWFCSSKVLNSLSNELHTP